MSYILYIDESGDEGIDPKNDKQSPYFFLGAFLIHRQEQPKILDIIKNAKLKLEKIYISLH